MTEYLREGFGESKGGIVGQRIEPETEGLWGMPTALYDSLHINTYMLLYRSMDS